MPNLFLLRHFKSQWNKENRFTGWVDVPLAEGEDAKEWVSKKIFSFNIEKIYSSPLIRNQQTVLKILENKGRYPIFIHLDKGRMKDRGSFEEINNDYIPVYISESLNERYYGKLQGLNKDETIERYGREKVRLFRRSFDIAPLKGESLKDVYKRAVPFFKRYIERDLKEGKDILVVASHNSLRALLKHIEKVPDKDIINYEIPFGGLIKYELDSKMAVTNKEVVAKDLVL
ncbi:MAG: histidine phosphatase family protein [Candidatus Pacebacteria bacterium]|nr:histidine phosphatase family protein [Candidatus Paceibacterota bacterium]